MSKKEIKEEVISEVVEKVEPVKDVVKPTVKSDKDLSITELIKKYTIKDSDGRDSFVNKEAIEEALTIDGEELSKKIGGKDPNIYFYQGKINKQKLDILGDLLDEDRLEVVSLRQAAPQYPEILVFKDRYQNSYRYLIPKRLSEFELDEKGDFFSPVPGFQICLINFNGAVKTKEYGAFPSAFEPMFFKNYFKRTLKTLAVNEEKHKHLF